MNSFLGVGRVKPFLRQWNFIFFRNLKSFLWQGLLSVFFESSIFKIQWNYCYSNTSRNKCCSSTRVFPYGLDHEFTPEKKEFNNSLDGGIGYGAHPTVVYFTSISTDTAWYKEIVNLPLFAEIDGHLRPVKRGNMKWHLANHFLEWWLRYWIHAGRGEGVYPYW